MTRTTHEPDWSWDGEFWNDENQPDADQFPGTSEEWLELLASQGIRPPAHADLGAPYAPETVLVDTGTLGMIYRVGGDTATLAMRSRHTGEWQATGQ